MLYMCELNKKNVLICKQIFDINSECQLNIYEGDSLKLNYKEQFNINKNYIIMSNPPYNDASGNKGKGHALWTKFIDLALTEKLLKKNGYLVYIHPSVWRQIDHPYLNVLKNKQLIYLEIHNTNDGQKTFKCATRYDWYVLKNIKYYTDTQINDEERIIHKINLNEWNFIPNMMFGDIRELITNNKKIVIHHSESYYDVRRNWMSNVKTNVHIYPCIYSINKKNENLYKWSKINNKGHFGIIKFIFSNGAGFCCDINGKYGMTQWSSGIEDKKENLPKIEVAFRSIQFNKIKKAIQLDSSTYNIKVMKLFKKDFYNYFL